MKLKQLNTLSDFQNLFSICFFFFNFYWSIAASQCHVSFSRCGKVNQSCVRVYPLFLRAPAHVGPRRALSRVPCGLQRVHWSSSLYIVVCICQSQFIPPFLLNLQEMVKKLVFLERRSYWSFSSSFHFNFVFFEIKVIFIYEIQVKLNHILLFFL